MTAPSPTNGWSVTGRASVAHFFVAGRSLCGRWRTLGPASDVGRHCQACERKVAQS